MRLMTVSSSLWIFRPPDEDAESCDWPEGVCSSMSCEKIVFLESFGAKEKKAEILPFGGIVILFMVHPVTSHLPVKNQAFQVIGIINKKKFTVQSKFFLRE